MKRIAMLLGVLFISSGLVSLAQFAAGFEAVPESHLRIIQVPGAMGIGALLLSWSLRDRWSFLLGAGLLLGSIMLTVVQEQLWRRAEAAPESVAAPQQTLTPVPTEPAAGTPKCYVLWCSRPATSEGASTRRGIVLSWRPFCERHIKSHRVTRPLTPPSPQARN